MPRPGGDRSIAAAEPGKVDIRFLKTYDFSVDGSVTLEQELPWMIITNVDTVAHTITGKPRNAGQGSGSSGAAPKFQVPAGGMIPVPTLPFGSLVADGPSAGVLFCFYSDVGAGPRGAAGSGLAASVQKASEVLNSVTTAKMYGAGTGGTAWTYTPKSTGIVRVTWDAFMLGSGNVSANATMELLPTYGDSSVVAAPAAGANPPGGSVAPGSGIGFNPTGGMADFSAWNQHDSYTAILFLTAAHTYWFDFEASYTGFTAVQLGGAQISFQELAS